MSRLIMRRGPQPGRTFDLNADIITIGSGSKNSIVILDNDVSREHCKLIRVMADYELQDLNSTRGTFVSGQRVRTSWVLKPGAFIELGENVTLEYERSAASEELSQVSDEPPVHAYSDRPPDGANPFLVMTVGPKPGNVIALKTPEIRIGRDLTNDITIQDPEISRFHAVLRWSNNAYYLEDLGSTNGTMLNGKVQNANKPTMLHTNDLIQVATVVEMCFTWQPDDVKIDSANKLTRPDPRRTTRETTQIAVDTSESNPFAAKARRQTTKLGTGLKPGSLEDHVFIAYARSEWESIVVPLSVSLQDANQQIWVDQYLVQGGDDWMIAVEQALAECWLLLIVVSPEALDSRYVRLAYRYFRNREKPIIPFLYANTESLPPELSQLKTVRYDPKNREQSFRELLAEIRSLKS